jgi:hypothetical protein
METKTCWNDQIWIFIRPRRRPHSHPQILPAGEDEDDEEQEED